MSVIKNILRKAMPPKAYGEFTYRRNPALGRAWGGPMNGQAGRCKLVADIIIRCKVSSIIETGTYKGTTTEWLAAFKLHIISCEYSEENFWFSKARLKGIENITLILDDSRRALRRLLNESTLRSNSSALLFYLDAHWGEDLPLAEELECIFSSQSEAVVLVDDFKVPDDDAYGFDDYGPEKALVPEYLGCIVDKYDLECYYPMIKGAEETGAKRGCVVICKREAKVSVLLKGSPLLRSI